MKRKILALATALALALSLSVCVSAAGQQAGSWTKLSDGYTADTPGTQPTAVPLPDNRLGRCRPRPVRQVPGRQGPRLRRGRAGRQ